MGAGIRVLLAGVFFHTLAVLCHSEPATVALSSPDLETLSAAWVSARVIMPLPPHLAGGLPQPSNLHAAATVSIGALAGVDYGKQRPGRSTSSNAVEAGPDTPVMFEHAGEEDTRAPRVGSDFLF
jgi:hypothetical protein